MATLVHWQTDRVSGELVMTGPVLVANGENKYHIIPGHADNVHLVSGPVYPTDAKHRFNPCEPRHEMPKNMIGPVYDVLHEHHFREVISAALALSNFSTSK